MISTVASLVRIRQSRSRSAETATVRYDPDVEPIPAVVRDRAADRGRDLRPHVPPRSLASTNAGSAVHPTRPAYGVNGLTGR